MVLIKTLVTGGSGFIGSQLIRSLKKQRGFQLRIADRRTISIYRPQTMSRLISGVDVVVHLAGANRAGNIELLRTNALGTLGLLEGIAKFSPTARLVFASSVQVYWPGSFYGLTKLMTEQLIEKYTSTSQMKAIILRLSNVYGPGGRPFYNSVVATFAHQLSRNETLKIRGDGFQTRDYIYVQDVVEAIIKAIEYEPKEAFDVFDICSGRSTSLSDIVRILETILGHRIPVHYEGMEGAPINDVSLDSSKALNAFGWKAETSLECGLRAVLESTSRKNKPRVTTNARR